LFLYAYQRFPVAGRDFLFRIGECAVEVEHYEFVFHVALFWVAKIGENG